MTTTNTTETVTAFGGEDRTYTWSSGSYELAGVCWCGDFSCESASTGRCVNADFDADYEDPTDGMCRRLIAEGEHCETSSPCQVCQPG